MVMYTGEKVLKCGLCHKEIKEGSEIQQEQAQSKFFEDFLSNI